MLDDLLKSLRLYCERTDDSFFAEPLGFLSNLGFIMVGFWMLRQARKNAELRILGYLAVAVGVGSGLFHAIPNRVTQVADVGPIGFFCAAFLWRYIAQLRLEGENPRRIFLFCLFGYALPVGLAFAFGVDAYLANGAFYMGITPTILILAYFDKKAKRSLILYLSGFVFLGAFTARSLDLQLCPDFPMGTHFLWHLLNAGVMLCLARALSAGLDPVLSRRESP